MASKKTASTSSASKIKKTEPKKVTKKNTSRTSLSSSGNKSKIQPKKLAPKKVVKKAVTKKSISKTAPAKTKKVLLAKKNVAVKKLSITPKAKTKKAEVLASEKNKIKNFEVKKNNKPAAAGAKDGISKSLNETNLLQIKNQNNDLSLTPYDEENHPLTTIEIHQAENNFHHKEEVAFHQENKKVRDALPSRKNMGFNRKIGRR